MKRFTHFLVYLLILNILICFTLLLNIYSNQHNITQSSIEISIASNDNYNLIEQILKDTNKKDLIKFIDYIELSINQSIENDTYDYTSFTITLPQNKSFIALYKKNSNGTYTFNSLIDNLSSIDSFYFYKDFFIVEQYSEKNLDSIENQKFIEIFYNQGSIYVSTLKKDMYKKSINSSNTENILSGSIDFLDGDIPRILYVSTYTDTISKEFYEWDSKLCTFKLSKKEIVNNK